MQNIMRFDASDLKTVFRRGVLVYSEAWCATNGSIPSGNATEWNDEQLHYAATTVNSFARQANGEFQRQRTYVSPGRTLGNAFVSPHLAVRFIDMLNQYILGALCVDGVTLGDTFLRKLNEKLNAQCYHKFRTTIWEVVVRVFQWACTRASEAEGPYHVMVIVDTWLEKLVDCKLARDYRLVFNKARRAATSINIPTTLVHREAIHGNKAVPFFMDQFVSTTGVGDELRRAPCSGYLLTEDQWEEWDSDFYDDMGDPESAIPKNVNDDSPQFLKDCVKVRHLLKWVQTAAPARYAAFFDGWDASYENGGTSSPPFPVSWLGKEADDRFYDTQEHVPVGEVEAERLIF